MYSNIINNLQDISQGTKNNYIVKSNRCQKLGINILGQEQKIINTITNLLGEKRNCLMEYINVCIVIRRNQNMPHSLLISHRNHLREYIQNNPTETNEELSKKELPSFEDLINHMNKQFENKNYRSYIINYLLIYINCRVLDLDIFISTGQANKVHNYLLIKDNKVTFIRNNYKTKKIYGVKINEIEDEKFYISCNNILEHRSVVELSEGHSGINNYIRPKLYKKISPSQYFKIVVNQSSKDDLLRLSNNRGTSVETILKSYNINQKF